ncbi:MAG: ribonuclease HII [Lactobacillaceae bacterium]|jgi:ribonuclease HII|nr:ribonuclease HII [Lactobacillaceae bacterium]
MMQTIGEIKQRLAMQPSAEELALWQTDARLGVQKLLLIYANKQAKLAAQKQAFNARLEFEKKAWANGKIVAGIDEVGRGPLAGPVVAAAVVIDDTFDLVEVHDSKQLSGAKRDLLVDKIKASVIDYAFGIVEVATIDEINIYEASRVAMKQALAGLQTPVDELLIDAMVVDSPLPQAKLIKGDDRSISIGAASILAKVYRDQLMAEYDVQYPGYGFARNAGYGTAEHLAGMEKLGITPLHRKSFAPVKKYLN